MFGVQTGRLDHIVIREIIGDYEISVAFEKYYANSPILSCSSIMIFCVSDGADVTSTFFPDTIRVDATIDNLAYAAHIAKRTSIPAIA